MLLGMPHPAVTISTRGAERLRQGHPWIYRSDIRESAAEPGDLVRVVSERGRPLGVGFWSSESQISLRFHVERHGSDAELLNGLAADDHGDGLTDPVAERLGVLVVGAPEREFDSHQYGPVGHG